MNGELIRQESQIIRDSDILNPDYSFEEKIEVASKVATSLKKVVDNQNLAVEITNKRGITKEYVMVEGWEVLGTMLGCTPYVEDVVELEVPGKHKSYFAYKAIVSIRHGETILSRAYAMAERNDRQSERHAVYSMAQTRALGKAYRMALSWIVKMAGYEPTPAEEMPQFHLKNVVEAKTVEKKPKVNKPIEAEIVEPEPVFETADNIDEIDKDPVTENFVKSLIRELYEDNMTVNKNNILKYSFQHLKKKEISNADHKKVLQWTKENCPEDVETLEQKVKEEDYE